MDKCRHPYRVFISYSHHDEALADKLEAHLCDCGVIPVRDTSITAGTRFSDEIKRKISFSHVFVTLLTGRSTLSPWVHQEMAYAMGLGVPVLPLALDELPGGMAHEIHASPVAPDLSDLPKRLTARNLDNLVASAQDAGRAMFECANDTESRTRALVGYARSLRQQDEPCRIRQRAAFTSFSLPSHGAKHKDWDMMEGCRHRDDPVRELLRQERAEMEEHARRGGCDLIIDPYVVLREDPRSCELTGKHPHGSTIKRLEILRDFVTGMTTENLRIAIQEGGIDGNTIIIGDWVLAEAVIPHRKTGYRQTILTRHAPTVLATIEEFDRDFADASSDFEPGDGTSNQAVINMLRRRIEELQQSGG